MRSLLTFAVVCALAIALALWACVDNTTVGITPTTAIVVRSDTLVAGYGCGVGPGQVYKYAAVVVEPDASGNPSGPIVAAQVFDCFADGTFVSLNPSDSGSLTFFVLVYAYDKTQYDADEAAAMPTFESAVGAANSSHVNDFPQIPATWTTSCTATQQANVEVLALCGPLTPAGQSSDGGEDGPATDAPPGDAPTDGSGEAAPAEAATDAPTDSPLQDTGDASAPDAPADGAD